MEKPTTSCFNCSQPYNLTAATPVLNGRLPLNLKCHHTLCNICLTKIIKHKEPVECRICKTTTEISSGDQKILSKIENLPKLFPINSFMLGEMLMKFNAKIAQPMGDDYSAEYQRGDLNSLTSTKTTVRIACSMAFGKTNVIPNEYKFQKQSMYPGGIRGTLACHSTSGNKEMMFENLSLYESADNSTKIDLYDVIVQNVSTKKECSECGTATTMACKQCTLPLCDVCFNRIHAFKSLASHTKMSVEATEAMCPLHTDKPLEFYCETCKKTLCSTCKHLSLDKCDTYICLKQKNTESVEELKAGFEKVDEIFRRLTATAVQLNDFVKSTCGSGLECDKLEVQLRLHFARVHANAQYLEHSIMRRIEEAKFKEKASIKKCLEDTVANITKAKRILSKLTTALQPENIGKVNVIGLLDEVQQFKSTPWYLTSVTEDRLEFEADESILTQIGSHVVLKGTSTGYKLDVPENMNNIPPAPAKPVLPQKLIRDVREKVKKPAPRPISNNLDQHSFAFKKQEPGPSTASPNLSISHIRNAIKESMNRNKSEKVASSMFKFKPSNESDTSSEACSSKASSSSQMSRRQNVQRVTPFTPLEIGSIEEVYVSHITSPHDFYVQQTCFQGKLKELMRDFQNIRRFASPNPMDIEKGKVYLGYFDPDNLWHRCRIISILTDDVSQPLYLVFFYDYGPYDRLTIDQLRVMPADKVLWPTACALRCSLYNIRPAEGGDWSQVSAYLMLKMLDKKKSAMLVKKNLGASEWGLKLECELATQHDGANIASALVFNKMACFIDPTQKQMDISGIVETLHTPYGVRFPIGEQEHVIITHVETPHHFYVRKSRLQSTFDVMSTDLEELYSGSNGLEYQLLYVEPGMCVATELPSNGPKSSKWCRARILNFPISTPNAVAMFLLDSGNKIAAPLDKIRRLPNNIITIQAMAEECSMANITMSKGKWCKEAIDLLRSHVDMQVSVTALEINRQKRERAVVDLYIISELNDEICHMNEELCRLGYAVRFGNQAFQPLQRGTHKKRLLLSRPTAVTTLEAPQRTMQQSFNTFENYRPKSQKPKASRVIPPRASSSKEEGPLLIEVTLVSVKSPSVIYCMLTATVETIKKTVTEMQIAYNVGENTKLTNVEVGKRAAYQRPAGVWTRVTILKVLDGGKVTVFEGDYGETLEIDSHSLYELKDPFSEQHDGTFKCHLAGITPADGEKWPVMTCEFLEETIARFDHFYISRKGDIVDKSLSVELMVYIRTPGSALEPDRGEWASINKLIVEQGLAVPIKSEIPENEVMNEEEAALSAFNLGGTLDEWLQLEPIKKDSSNDLNTENEPTTSGELQGSLLSDWLPPEPPQYDTFFAVPTFVDMDFVIYLHDIAAEETLRLINQALENKYSTSDPRPVDLYWSENLPAIAKYELEDAYYRARVVQVLEGGKVKIIFVDYGNMEIVANHDMRKGLAMTSTPIQAIKCQLHNIAPVGPRWHIKDLDFAHGAIVDKQCEVHIVGPKVNDIYPIELKLNNADFATMLVALQYAVFKNDLFFTPMKQPPLTDDEEEEDQSKSVAAPLTHKDWNAMIEEETLKYRMPDLEDSFYCQVCSIVSVNQIEVVIDDDHILYSGFEDLMKVIQEEGDLQPAINNPSAGKPCLAKYTDDNLWYRACVISHTDTLVKVQYVDFGNEEELNLSDLRVIKEEWLEIPKKCVVVVLNDIAEVAEVDFQPLSAEYSAVFEEKRILAKIIDKSSLKVDLFDVDTDTLAYQSLIDKGNLIKSNEHAV